jgi:hypothetical protein
MDAGGMTMSVTVEAPPEQLFADKVAIQAAVEEQHRLMGFEREPGATAIRAREMMLALGIRPEDNLFSRGIIAARDEE